MITSDRSYFADLSALFVLNRTDTNLQFEREMPDLTGERPVYPGMSELEMKMINLYEDVRSNRIKFERLKQKMLRPNLSSEEMIQVSSLLKDFYDFARKNSKKFEDIRHSLNQNLEDLQKSLTF